MQRGEKSVSGQPKKDRKGKKNRKELKQKEKQKLITKERKKILSYKLEYSKRKKNQNQRDWIKNQKDKEKMKLETFCVYCD